MKEQDQFNVMIKIVEDALLYDDYDPALKQKMVQISQHQNNDDEFISFTILLQLLFKGHSNKINYQKLKQDY